MPTPISPLALRLDTQAVPGSPRAGTQPDPHARSAAAASGFSAQVLAQASRVLLALVLCLLATLVAAAAAWALESGLALPPHWAAPVGAGLTVLTLALPLLLWFRPWAAPALLRPAPEALPGPASAPDHSAAQAGFLELADREWARARRYGTGAALLLIDVDRYQRLCEARGGSAGDAVLATLLRHTAPTLRGADALTRFGDAQMAVFLAQADATGALDVAERIREHAEQLDVLHHQQGLPQRLRVTVSVGVAQLRASHPSLHALIDDAQAAVAAARLAGGNCVRAAPNVPPPSRSAGWRDDQRERRK